MLPVENIDAYSSKNILKIENASLLIKKFKEFGKKVGLCHGGYDLLHPGQVKHLESAKKLCDVLFVSVTADKFVSSRKGFGRPILNEKLRAYMIAKLDFVDYVVISDYPTGVEVIELLKPSYYIKGPDFINKFTPGINAERTAITEVGGEMKYTTDEKLSTTEIIKYIKENVDCQKVLLCIDRDGTIIEEEGFLGREETWRDSIRLNENVISFLSFIQTKYETKKIVVSNQAGVARKLFNCMRVEEINRYVDCLLKGRGIKIDDWEYCPDVDSKFAELKKNEIEFDYNFVKEKTKRKPDDAMVLDGLEKIRRNINDFSSIIVLGDREEDQGLAKKINAIYIDARETYEEMVKKVESALN